MELCFVPKNGNYVQFIQAYSLERKLPLNNTEGDIITEDGTVIGRHNGVHNYTIGQRKGLGFATSKPVYVLSIDTEKNRIVVGEDEALRSSTFEVEGVNWISIAEPSTAIRAEVKIRHKHEPSPAAVEALPGNRARITFDSPQRAITPVRLRQCIPAMWFWLAAGSNKKRREPRAAIYNKSLFLLLRMKLILRVKLSSTGLKPQKRQSNCRTPNFK